MGRKAPYRGGSTRNSAASRPPTQLPTYAQASGSNGIAVVGGSYPPGTTVYAPVAVVPQFNSPMTLYPGSNGTYYYAQPFSSGHAPTPIMTTFAPTPLQQQTGTSTYAAASAAGAPTYLPSMIPAVTAPAPVAATSGSFPGYYALAVQEHPQPAQPVGQAVHAHGHAHAAHLSRATAQAAVVPSVIKPHHEEKGPGQGRVLKAALAPREGIESGARVAIDQSPLLGTEKEVKVAQVDGAMAQAIAAVAVKDN